MTFVKLSASFFFLISFSDSTESRRPSVDQKVYVLLPVSLPADWSQRTVDLSQCAGDMSLTPRRWGMEETCQLILSVYTVLTAPKNASCFSFDIFDARNKKPAAAMRIRIVVFSIHLEGPHDVVTSLQLWTGQTTITCRKCLRFVGCVCVCVCVCVCGQ